MAAKTDNTKKILLGVGCGCLALVGFCCVSAGGLAMWQKSSYDSAGQAHAERFLGFVQQRDYGAAFGATQYMGGDGLYSADTFTACIMATPLADLTSYTCTDTDSGWPGGDGVDVVCTIVSASQGSSEITIDVNSPDTWPYLGFIWFSPTVTTGAEWHGDACATWSGREYYREPPPGRVRP